MKQFFTVFRFTFLDAVRKKAFIISTAILFILILAACMIPRAIEWFSPDSSQANEETLAFSSETIIYLLDESGAIENAEGYLSAAATSGNIEARNKLLERNRKYFYSKHYIGEFIYEKLGHGKSWIKRLFGKLLHC